MEQSPLSLLSILSHNLASRSNSEMTNHVHNITYGGQRPNPRTSKFMSVYLLHLWSIWRKCTHDNSEETISILHHNICRYNAKHLEVTM